MVQIFPEDRTTKCTLFDESSPSDGVAKCLSHRTQLKRPRVSTKLTKETSDEEHFVTIHLSGNGPPQIKSSASLRLYKDYIVGGALTRFLECIIEAKSDSTSPADAQQGLTTPLKTTIQPEAPCISYPFAKRAKRRRSSSSVAPTASDPGDNAGDDDSDNASRSSERLIPLQIGDVEQCRGFFLLGFQAIQQIDCRFLAKRWIKKIEPKKQVHHPYNGGKRDPKDPEATKPQWWPPGMTHKEPDHINKSDRITLLTHLIMNTGRELLTSVDTGSAPMVKDLEEVTKPYVAELKNPKSWSILQEMFTTRRYMELVEFEGNDPEMYHKMVVDRSSDTRRAQGEPKHIIDDDDPVECPEPRSFQAEDDQPANMKAEPTPTSSILPSPVTDSYLSKDQVMHGTDHQDRLLYDTVPSGRFMKSTYSEQLPISYDRLTNHHSNLQSMPQYVPMSVYARGQALEHQLYQRTNGSIPGLQQGVGFSPHTLLTSQPTSMSHWTVTEAPDFGFPTQYQAMHSQAPTMQPTTSEQPILDDGPYQVHQQDPHQAIQFPMPIFSHHPPQTAFSETREIGTPRWGHLAYRPVSGSETSVPHLNDISIPSTTEQLYQTRLHEHSEFE